jgi:hypothetical protein
MTSSSKLKALSIGQTALFIDAWQDGSGPTNLFSCTMDINILILLAFVERSEAWEQNISLTLPNGA